jgi:type VI secretion system Hcp family effector
MLAGVQLTVSEAQGGAVLFDRDVFEARHAVAAPAQANQPTGRRTHDPFRVVVALGRETVALAQAAEQSRLLTVRLAHFYYHSGRDFEGLRIELAGARIQSIHDVMPVRRAGTERLLVAREELVFSYERITWSCVNALPTRATGGRLSPAAVNTTFTDTVGQAGESQR